MGRVFRLTTSAMDGDLAAKDRVLVLALNERNALAAKMPPDEAFLLQLVAADSGGLAVIPQGPNRRLSLGGPVGPKPAATNHGSDDGEAG